MTPRFIHIPPSDLPGNAGSALVLLDQVTGQYFVFQGNPRRWQAATPALFKPSDGTREGLPKEDAENPLPWA